MAFFVVHIPDEQPHTERGVTENLPPYASDAVDALSEVYAGHILAMEIAKRDAILAGWCDACPPICRSCTGDRSSCECYEHDNPLLRSV